jgi:histidine triad (HIT) family protein
METIFTKIINREIPGHFLYEDDTCVAIMDVFPSIEGQSLVILKREVSYLFDTTDEEYQHLLSVARNVAKATDIALGTERTCLVVEGFEVPHVHIKLFPFKTAEGASLAKTIGNPMKAEPEVLATIANRIKACL